jgi:cation transport regulator ChaB
MNIERRKKMKNSNRIIMQADMLSGRARDAYDDAVKSARDTYDDAVKSARDTYDDAVKSAKDAYDATEEGAGNAYVNATKPARDVFYAAVKSARETYDVAAENAVIAALTMLCWRGDTTMTKEDALMMLVSAEKYIYTLIPEKSFAEEYPIEAATIQTLETARRTLARELRNSSSSTTEKQN